MRVLVVTLTFVTACSYHGRDVAQDGRTGADGVIADARTFADASADAIPGDAPVLCEQWSPHHFDPCAIPAPGPTDWDITAGTHVYDTDTDLLDGAPIIDTIGAGTSITFDQGTNQPARLLSVPTFKLTGGETVLQITGSMPLIIAAWNEIEIGGTLDAGTHTANGVIGAGSEPAACAAVAATAGGNADAGGGSGGGGGGAFQGKGGDGGTGDNASPSAGGISGDPVGVPAVLRGGCTGATSGTAGPGAVAPSTSSTRTPGGPGGGAIQLAAFAKVKITAGGHVVAGGGGGPGSPMGSGDGGGGGGSGGQVVLDAPEVDVDGTVAANGGAGGASQTFTLMGDGGDDGQPDATAAVGGAAVGTCATAGGIGSAAAQLAGADVTGIVSCGGGGGGGGAGYIVVWSAAYTPAGGATLSPPVTENP